MNENNNCNDEIKRDETNQQATNSEASPKAMDLADIILQGSSDGVLDDQALKIIEAVLTVVSSKK